MTQAPIGQPVTDGAALLSRLQSLRDGALGYTTTFFAKPAQVDAWVARRAMFELDFPGCILVLRRAREFFHLYHAAASTEALRLAVDRSAEATRLSPAVADLVGKGESLVTMIDAYRTGGFATHSRLVRMVRNRQTSTTAIEIEAEVELAAPADAPSILTFFERLLDPFAEQVPDLAELEALAASGNILVVRRRQELGGVLVYEMQGQSAILRYWWVNDRFRDAGIGGRLIRSMFHFCRDATRTVLWVIEGNDNAITKYEHYGFRREGLVDQVMIRRGDTRR